MPSQVSLGRQPAQRALVGVLRPAASVVAEAAAWPLLRSTVVVRGPSFRCYFLDQRFGRSSLQPLLLGRLLIRLRRLPGLLVQAPVASLPFLVWREPQQDGVVFL